MLLPQGNDDTFFCEYVPTGQSFTRSFTRELDKDCRFMTRLERLEKINNWNRLGDGKWIYWI